MAAVIGVVDLGGGWFHTYMKNKYLNALRAAGAAPVVLPWARDAAEAEAALAECRGLLLPGGADIAPALYGQTPEKACGKPNPARDTAEPLYFAAARRRGLPVLGICRGCQLLNVLAGGTLWQDLKEMPGAHRGHMDFLRRGRAVHTVTPQAGTRLAALCGPVQGVNSMHHQALREIGPGLVCAAVSQDGVPEAVEEREGPFLLGVQWHPEHLYQRDACAQRIFAAFAAAAQAEQ